MSTQETASPDVPEEILELTALGKKLEFLRIERGVSKQRLAKHAGTSRQQLWRVMTGKSELTRSLRERLAFALNIEPASLVATNPESTQTLGANTLATFTLAPVSTRQLTVNEYLTQPEHLAATLRSLPTGDGGRRLKRALLNALEDLAVETGRSLPLDYSEIHRRVLAGEI
ncbi:MAG: helix-turn-helix transcriptional regulator [Gemmatimonadota bacterium]